MINLPTRPQIYSARRIASRFMLMLGLMLSLCLGSMAISTQAAPDPVQADPAACAANPKLANKPVCGSNASATCTTRQCDLIEKYVNPAINLLSIIFGLIVTISIILGSIQYASSAGDPQKVSAAKQRITMTLMAFVAYAFLFAFLQFLIPGGLFKR